MSKPEILKLSHPVVLADGKKLDHLEVRRPTVGDVLDLPPDGGDVMLRSARLAARLCGLNIEDLRLLDLQDFDALDDMVARFRKPAQG
ncbi:MAG: phage tail assembly protein [Desulfovibrio sp.]|nr:phage tail assembly protein [Desulfovibrio sp.]